VVRLHARRGRRARDGRRWRRRDHGGMGERRHLGRRGRGHAPSRDRVDPPALRPEHGTDQKLMPAARAQYRSIISDNSRWAGFEFRPGDIVISTPPKCGTTWMQMICALLVFQTPDFDGSLDLISPWLEMLTRDRDSVFADLAAQTHRRFIKSHTPF